MRVVRAPALAASLALSLGLAACDPGPAPDAGASASSEAPAPQPSVPASASVAVVADTVEPAGDLLALEGLGDLRIGRPVPADSTWRADEVQASDTCLTYASPGFPGVYAIVEEGEVRRISLGEGSALQLAGGIAVGAEEAAVRKAFPRLMEEPHVYEDAPAKYLTMPAANGAPALRFEIGTDRKVEWIHAGIAPTLEYVEACA